MVVALPGPSTFPPLLSIPPLWSILSGLHPLYFPAYDLVNGELWQNSSRLEPETWDLTKEHLGASTSWHLACPVFVNFSRPSHLASPLSKAGGSPDIMEVP